MSSYRITKNYTCGYLLGFIPVTCHIVGTVLQYANGMVYKLLLWQIYRQLCWILLSSDSSLCAPWERYLARQGGTIRILAGAAIVIKIRALSA
jgi:hypothetical protein